MQKLHVHWWNFSWGIVRDYMALTTRNAHKVKSVMQILHQQFPRCALRTESDRLHTSKSSFLLTRAKPYLLYDSWHVHCFYNARNCQERFMGTPKTTTRERHEGDRSTISGYQETPDTLWGSVEKTFSLERIAIFIRKCFFEWILSARQCFHGSPESRGIRVTGRIPTVFDEQVRETHDLNILVSAFDRYIASFPNKRIFFMVLLPERGYCKEGWRLWQCIIPPDMC